FGVKMAEAVNQTPGFKAFHPLAFFREETAFTRLQPALGVVRADTDVAILRRDIHVAHHYQWLVVAEAGFQQGLQVIVEALFGREFGRVIAAFTLWEIAIHDGYRLAVVVRESPPDETLLRF